METVDVSEVEFSVLLRRVEQGEVIVISSGGKPIAKLVPATDQPAFPRQPGLWEGKVWIADDFNRLPDELENAFFSRLVDTP